MSDTTAISWTDHTFNPWWGCSRVSPACRFCYADRDATRYGFELWRRHGDRRMLSDANWAKPLTWNRKAESAGVPARVFCASMADVFEDHPAVAEPRARLWDVIERTPHLRWQLLTKRIENVAGMVPWGTSWPASVWIGTSVESQTWAEKRIPELLKLPAAVRFLSCEPLLGKVDIAQRGWLPFNEFDSYDGDGECLKCGTEEITRNEDGEPQDGHPVTHYCYSPECPAEGCDEEGSLTGEWCDGPIRSYPHVDWVIAGGESGPKARPSDSEWFRSLRTQCQAAGVPFHFKQAGKVLAREWGCADRTGHVPAEWPEFFPQDFPAPVPAAA